MKNALFLFVSILLVNTALMAQRTPKTKMAKVNVPAAVDASFKQSFANALDAKWSKNYSGNFLVNYTNDAGLAEQTSFNIDGVVLKTATIFDAAVCPQVIVAAVDTKYAGAKLDACEKINIPGIAPYYKVKLTTADLISKEILVSEDGSIARL